MRRMSVSSCLGRAAVPVKRVWRGLTSRLGRRRRTTTYVPPVDDDAEEEVLGRLRKEVRTCEYHDVHVMWEMLSTSGMGGGSRGVAAKSGTTRRKQPWSRLVTYCCGAF